MTLSWCSSTSPASASASIEPEQALWRWGSEIKRLPRQPTFVLRAGRPDLATGNPQRLVYKSEPVLSRVSASIGTFGLIRMAYTAEDPTSPVSQWVSVWARYRQAQTGTPKAFLMCSLVFRGLPAVSMQSFCSRSLFVILQFWKVTISHGGCNPSRSFWMSFTASAATCEEGKTGRLPCCSSCQKIHQFLDHLHK